MKRTLYPVIATLLFLLVAGFTSNAQESASLPYANYKGIKDLSVAKAEWVKDNPDAYQKINNQTAQAASSKNVQQGGAPTLKYFNYKGIKDLDAAKQAWLADHPKYAKKIQANSIPVSPNVARLTREQRNAIKK